MDRQLRFVVQVWQSLQSLLPTMLWNSHWPLFPKCFSVDRAQRNTSPERCIHLPCTSGLSTACLTTHDLYIVFMIRFLSIAGDTLPNRPTRSLEELSRCLSSFQLIGCYLSVQVKCPVSFSAIELARIRGNWARNLANSAMVLHCGY